MGDGKKVIRTPISTAAVGAALIVLVAAFSEAGGTISYVNETGEVLYVDVNGAGSDELPPKSRRRSVISLGPTIPSSLQFETSGTALS
jgi:hypothetical protein